MRGVYGPRTRVGEEPRGFGPVGALIVLGGLTYLGWKVLGKKPAAPGPDMSDVERDMLARGASKEHLQSYGW